MATTSTKYYVIAEGPDRGFVLRVQRTCERPIDGRLFVDGEWVPYDATLDVLFDHIDSIGISEEDAMRLTAPTSSQSESLQAGD